MSWYSQHDDLGCCMAEEHLFRSAGIVEASERSETDL